MKTDSPANMYLDLLKRSLTNTVFKGEPDIDDDEFRFAMNCAAHYVESNALSMITLARFDNIRNCIESILLNEIPGDLIETGVWRGGATIFMRGLLKVYGVTDRIVWAADSSRGSLNPTQISFRLKQRCSQAPSCKRYITTLPLP